MFERNGPQAAYDALDAFLLEHMFCRPGLDDPHIADPVVALWCACGARITVRLPAEAARRRGTVSDNGRPEPPRRRIKRGGVGMAMRRTVFLAALFALAIGCARPDWVGSTLATVDVTGEWQGSYTSGTSGGSIAMKLEQRGAKVTGTCQVSHPSGASGAVAGTVTGDKLRFDSASFLTGELTVGVDEMAGILNRASAAPGGIPGSRLSVLLRRQ